MMLAIIPILAAILTTAASQSYTFPLGSNQGYPQFNNAFESRYPYIPSQQMQMNSQVPSSFSQMNGYPSMNQNYQMNPMNRVPSMNQMSQMSQTNGVNSLPIHQRYSFNPMTRIQVQPPMQEPSAFGSPRVTSPVGASEYQVDQRVPLPTPAQSQSSSATRIIPPFLKSASVADQDKFYEIVQHPTWSGAEKNQRIEEFMKTMSDERQTMYSDFRRDVVDKEVEEKRRDVDRAVSSMSKEAVVEFQKVVRIMHDPTQPEPERLKKIEEIYSKLPDAIRKEFDVKLKGF